MKYLTLIALALASATSVQADFWDNCTAYGGTIITANSYGNDKGGQCNDPSDPNLTKNCNGKRFCWGLGSQNWWSAYTWCESIGGRLASFESVCPGTQSGVSGGNICPNALLRRGDTGGWTTLGSGNNKAAMVWFNWGDVDLNIRDQKSNNRRALCEE
jgi:hypothetical protein